MLSELLGLFDKFAKFIGWLVILLIFILFGFDDWISEKIDALYWLAYNWEKFGWKSILVRWFMLFSSLFVLFAIVAGIWVELGKEATESSQSKK